LKRGTALLLAAATCLVLLGSAQSALAFGHTGHRGSGNVNYNGGPISRSMTGVVVDWGSGVNPLFTDETNGDPGLLRYLAANSGSTGDIGGVLAQYMDNTGHNAANAVSYGHQYTIAPSAANGGTTLTDSQIQNELVGQIQSGNLPHPTGDGLQTIYLMLFPSGYSECLDDAATQCSGTTFCAYHGNATLADGTNVLYAVLPDNTSGAMAQGCGPTGSTSALLKDQTSFLSHEWSEAITDPTGQAWWNNNQSSAHYGNEIGDNCNQLTGLNGPWTVQLEWSNLTGSCLAAASSYSAPNASFLAPGGAAASQSVRFDASGSSDPAANTAVIAGTGYSIGSGLTSYQWNWGDGSSSAAGATATATHSYTAAGSYQVSLTVTDGLGFTSTVTHALAISTAGPQSPAATTGNASGLSDATATLNGTVEPAGQTVQYQFLYGTSTGSLSEATPLASGPQSAGAVSATISGLQPATTYYFELQVSAGGQTYPGAVQSFTTAATAPPAQTPAVATGSADQIAANAARLTGTIDPGGAQPVSYRFAYGTSAGSLTLFSREISGLSGTTSVPVSAVIAGLRPHTTYYFRLDASLGGQTYPGAVNHFTTLTPRPTASTLGVIRVGSSAATVLGSVGPNGVATNYHVEFGATAAYGHSTASLFAGVSAYPQLVTATLPGLAPRTLYHYRVVATSAGGTAVGSDRTFTTARAPGRPPRFNFNVPPRAGVRAALYGKLKVRFNCSKGCTARFAVTVAAAGVTRSAPVPLTLGHASAQLRGKGVRTATITFIPAIRNKLGRYRSMRLIVSGYATSPGSSPTTPLAAELRLT
jgi:PKD repeat protein